MIYARYDYIFNLVKNIEADYKSRSDYLTALNATISQKQAEVQTLTQEVESKQQKVVDLTSLGSKRETTIAELADLDAQDKDKRWHLAVLEALEGTENLSIHLTLVANGNLLRNCEPPSMSPSPKPQYFRHLYPRCDVW